MPHWIKKFVNAMENYSMPDTKSKRDLECMGGKINLGMIEKIWRALYLGPNSLCQSKLTENHFKKCPKLNEGTFVCTNTIKNCY